MDPNPRDPLFVVDWNVIQTVPLSEFTAPSNWDILIPDECALEAIDKDKSTGGIDPESALRKLARFCRAHSKQFWCAKVSGEIVRIPPTKRVRLRDLVHVGVTARYRRMLLKGDSDFVKQIEQAKDSVAYKDYLHRMSEFEQLGEKSRTWFGTDHRDLRSQINPGTALTEKLRDPSLPVGCFPPWWLERYSVQRDRLVRFPDVVPLAKWARVIAWYALLRARLPQGCKSDLAFSNNFADGNCLFLAMHTGHLLTNDRGLQQAARAIAPNVRIFEWSGSEKRLVQISKLK